MSEPTGDDYLVGKVRGGAAFPSDQRFAGVLPGMSLRDYFAAAALPAFINRYSTFFSSGVDCAWVAKGAYVAADAMLAERERKKE